MSCQNGSKSAARGASRNGIQSLSSTSAYLLGVTFGAIAGAGVYAKKRATETDLNKSVIQAISYIRKGAEAAFNVQQEYFASHNEGAPAKPANFKAAKENLAKAGEIAASLTTKFGDSVHIQAVQGEIQDHQAKVISGIQIFEQASVATNETSRVGLFAHAHQSISGGQYTNMPAFLSRPSTAPKDALAVGGAAAVATTGAILLARAYQRRRNIPASNKKKNRPQSNKLTPKPIPGLSGAGGGGMTRPAPKPIPGLSGARSSTVRSTPKPIPGLSGAPTQTKLKPTSISILGNDGDSKARAGYEVVREDGASTGLAITPFASTEQKRGKSSGEQWGVTHIQTGKLIDGPYADIPQAQGLATKLSSMRWTTSAIPQSNLRQARTIVDEHQRSLAGEH